MSADDQLSFLDAEAFGDLKIEIEQAAHRPEAKDLATQIREFHGWTIDKLEILRLYLVGGYVRVARGGTYVDGFAGQGMGSYRGQAFNGSALVAARSGAFRQLHFIEADKRSHARLAQHLTELSDREQLRCSLHPPGDCNDVIPELLRSGIIDPNRPCFAFLDPESTELGWSTIEALASYKTYRPKPDDPRTPESCKVELWILFNTHQAIYRLWTANRADYPESMGPDALDHLMGGRDAWWDLWIAGAPPVSLLHRYVERLEALGYRYVIPQPVRDPGGGAVQYYMIHVTDHPSALGLMRWAKRQTGRVYATELPGLDAY